MIRKFEIWNSQFNAEDYADFIEEDRELNPHLYEGNDEDSVIFQRIDELNQSYLDDERVNLDIQLEHPILVIADLGLWYGRKTGYKVIRSGNIRDILYAQVSGLSEQHWYCGGYNIRCDECHHDGTNHYIYREMKEDVSMDCFMERLLDAPENQQNLLKRYTRSIAKDVGRVYGICA